MENISGLVWTYDEVVTLLERLTTFPSRDTDALFEIVVEVYHSYRRIMAEQSTPADAMPALLCGD